MLALKPLALLILGVSLVHGNYWWMDTDAFGGNSDTQVKRASSGGYGGGGGNRNIQNVGGYPQNAGGYPQNTGGYPQNAGGYPQNAGGYPQSGGGYPQYGGNYPQNGDNNSPTNVQNPNNPSREKIQDYSGNHFIKHFPSNHISPQMLSVQPV